MYCDIFWDQITNNNQLILILLNKIFDLDLILSISFINAASGQTLHHDSERRTTWAESPAPKAIDDEGRVIFMLFTAPLSRSCGFSFVGSFWSAPSPLQLSEVNLNCDDIFIKFKASTQQGTDSEIGWAFL